MTTVLFTCVGQRAEIITAFRLADARTVATDISVLAPALYSADVQALTPRYDEDGYLERLAHLVEACSVDVILPLTDLDQLLLAENRGRLDALVLLPEPDVVRQSNDKFRCHLTLNELGLGSPRTWLADDLPDDLEFPLFLKLRFGSGSAWTRTAEDLDEVRFYVQRAPQEPIVQQLCRGDEFSIDVFCDLDGRCINAIPRTMLESKAGESVKGTTIEDNDLTALGQTVAERFGVVGPATIQCFRESDGRLLITDINLRFGGAFPLPTAAGSRYPEYVLALARGESLQPCVGEFEAGVTFAAYPTQVILEETRAGMAPASRTRITPGRPR